MAAFSAVRTPPQPSASSPWPKELDGQAGITALEEVDGQLRFVQIREVIAPTGKTLEEARGKVIADFQDHLEKSWIAELRARYPYEVNTEALHAIR